MERVAGENDQEIASVCLRITSALEAGPAAMKQQVSTLKKVKSTPNPAAQPSVKMQFEEEKKEEEVIQTEESNN